MRASNELKDGLDHECFFLFVSVCAVILLRMKNISSVLSSKKKKKKKITKFYFKNI